MLDMYFWDDLIYHIWAFKVFTLLILVMFDSVGVSPHDWQSAAPGSFFNMDITLL